MWKAKLDWVSPLLLIALVAIILLVGGCGVWQPVKAISSTPAEKVDCHYVRVKTEWSLKCKASGEIPLDQGSDIMELLF